MDSEIIKQLLKGFEFITNFINKRQKTTRPELPDINEHGDAGISGQENPDIEIEREAEEELKRAEDARLRGYYPDARKIYKKLIADFDKSDLQTITVAYRLIAAKAHVQSGHLSQNSGKYRDAESSYKKAIDIIETINDNTNSKAEICKGQAISGRANIYHIKDKGNANEEFKKAIKIFIEHDAPIEQAGAILGQGRIDYINGDYPGALKKYLAADILYNANEIFKFGHARVCLAQGKIHSAQGELGLAESCYEKAYAIYSDSCCIRGLASYLFYSGELDIEKDEYIDATKNLRAASRIAGFIDSPLDQVNSLMLLTEALLKRNQIVTAKQTLKNADKFFYDLESELGQMQVQVVRGYLCLKQDEIQQADIQQANTCFEKALNFYGDDNVTLNASCAILGAGKLAFMSGDEQTARERFNQAINICIELDSKRKLAEAYEKIAFLDYNTRDFDEADRRIEQCVENLCAGYYPHLLAKARIYQAIFKVEKYERGEKKRDKTGVKLLRRSVENLINDDAKKLRPELWQYIQGRLYLIETKYNEAREQLWEAKIRFEINGKIFWKTRALLALARNELLLPPEGESRSINRENATKFYQDAKNSDMKFKFKFKLISNEMEALKILLK